MWCDSDIHIFNNSSILSCVGLTDFKNREIATFDKYPTVFTEPIDDSSFLVVYDPITIQEMIENEEGRKYFYEERDSLSDNAIVYSIDGKTLYSFRFDGFYMPLSYQSYKLRTDSTNQLFLFDFDKSEYFLPTKDSVEILKLTQINRSHELTSQFKSYTVSSLIDDKSILISDSSVFLVK